jgi:hypothetical protein
MMDKISSSPSIDDGGYPISWLVRASSVSKSSPIVPGEENEHSAEREDANVSSSPFSGSEEGSRSPAGVFRRSIKRAVSPFFASKPSEYHHQREYSDSPPAKPKVYKSEYTTEESREPTPEQSAPLHPHMSLGHFQEDLEDCVEYGGDSDATEELIRNVQDAYDRLIAECDSSDRLDYTEFGTTGDIEPGSPSEDSMDWQSWVSSSEDSNEDDDTGESSFFDELDPRFVDSGWGGECLRETEDIDFEFVYALHTFVATVEGQANASKGDTMVLLDDSNSYWWLVRVVKDSSIGKFGREDNL